VLRERKLFKDVILAAFISTVFAIAPAFTVFRIVLDRVLVNNFIPRSMFSRAGFCS
jgi:ABC-type bacteriocin/lantibiotic exporter with double-glycine peptidase domain